MPDHSVVFDEDDPHCPVCGSDNIDETETEAWSSVWTCDDCTRWGRQSGYRGEEPISNQG